MNKQEFRRLFFECVNQALGSAEKRLGMIIGKDFAVELHGAGVSGDVVPPDRAIDLIYLGEDRFYLIVDIAVKAIVKDQPIIFVRISGHEPSTFDRTWNTPTGNGPFKIIEAAEIRIGD